MRIEPTKVMLIAACAAALSGTALADSGSSQEPLVLAQASTRDLFQLDDKAKEDKAIPPAANSDTPQSAESLFGVSSNGTKPEAKNSTSGLSGFIQNELAYTLPSPDHLSKWKTHARLTLQGALSENVKWKLSGHVLFDAAFSVNDFYSRSVRKDQEFEGWLHETYLDFTKGDWALRLGRQHIIWGEVVGLFFADVVSALDLREFVLPDFDLIRIPQWAARVEHYGEKLHLEAIWLPYVTADRIGRYGSDFYPIQTAALPPDTVFNDAAKRDPFEQMGYGVRASYLSGGWDLSGFYYSSPDKATALQRTVSFTPAPRTTFIPVHERIHQFGGTLAKDLGEGLIKAEAVYTLDRRSPVNNPLDVDGLMTTDELRYLLAYERAFGAHNVTVQFFQTWFVDHVPTMAMEKVENGLGLYYSTTALHPNVKPEILWIRSLDRNEWMLQAKVSWDIDAHWRLVGGIDVIEGPRAAPLLGQYDAKDRIYYELRYSF